MGNKRNVFIALLLIVVIIVAFGVNQVLTVLRAHSTFENYYAFRGCVKLIKRTDNYGICQLSNGQVIKMVKFQNKWYLDGDLPVCYFGRFCF